MSQSFVTKQSKNINFFINPFEESLEPSPLNEVQPSNRLKMGLVLILVNYYRIQWATQTGVKKWLQY
jgi:hypothetical protein